MHTLQEFRSMLRVNKHRLDDELEIQGEILDRISMQVVSHSSQAIEAKAELARIEGRVAEDVREAEPKLTVGAVEAKVNRDRDRLVAWQKYQLARAAHESWVGLLDAWRQKGFSIKTLADLYAAQYFSLSSTQVSARQRARDEDQDAARAKMRRSSHVDHIADAPAPSKRRALI